MRRKTESYISSKLYLVHHIGEEAYLIDRIDAIGHFVVLLYEDILLEGHILKVKVEAVADLFLIGIKPISYLHIEPEIG